MEVVDRVNKDGKPQEPWFYSKKFIKEKQKLRELYMPQEIKWTDPGHEEAESKVLPLTINCRYLRE